ncbi:F-box/RNI-like superfamily protein [Rhynchospora pubera]|uniref:F-box/RNI-like superfamily protein n=1 Tax=Rhynchospora pubera TaxID=906938 RepID=A0AAV8HTT4_9POAL|nr:F-box/RNI-like superfamily protein [Rhynchospora pubera]
MPDAVLHHIPSLLETHEAVRMCTLLKRWRNVWTYLPDLTFDVQTFFSSSPPVPEQRTLFPITGRKSNLDRFVQFVSRVLLKHQPIDLRILHHNCSGGGGLDFEEDYIKAWIVYAVKHNVRVLHLKTNSNYSFPSGISSLEKLHISVYCDDSHVLTDINLPNLRDLYLKQVYLDNYFSKLLFSGFPILEKHSPNLEKLVLDHDGQYFWCMHNMEGESSLSSTDTDIGSSDSSLSMGGVAADNSMRLLSIKCKNLSEVEVKYLSNDSSVKQLVNALVDGTVE